MTPPRAASIRKAWRCLRSPKAVSYSRLPLRVKNSPILHAAQSSSDWQNAGAAYGKKGNHYESHFAGDSFQHVLGRSSVRTVGAGHRIRLSAGFLQVAGGN